MSRHVTLHTAAAISGVKPGTIRRWVHDGHVIRYEDGYDVRELLRWVKARNLDALKVRAGMPGEHATRLRRRSA